MLRRQSGILRERLSVLYACYSVLSLERTGKEWNGNAKIKDGHIVVENPLFQELPTHEVTIKSGRTLYRFTGSYDGERSLPHKVLRLMEQEKAKKMLIKNAGADKIGVSKSCIGRLPADERSRNYC